MRPALTASVGKGMKQAFPIMLGCVPIGAAYGLLAQQTGLSFWATVGMSLFVCAGASQFIAVSMLYRGMGAAAIIGTAFIVNFRHVLMSAAVAPSVGFWRTWQRVLLGWVLTDETFILHSLNFNGGDTDPLLALALNFSVYPAWVTASAVGYHLGAVIANPAALGLDFTLTAMFVGLLISACANRQAVIAAVAGGAVSVALNLLNAGSWAAFLGALAGATVGVFFFKEEGAEAGS